MLDEIIAAGSADELAISKIIPKKKTEEAGGNLIPLQKIKERRKKNGKREKEWRRGEERGWGYRS